MRTRSIFALALVVIAGCSGPVVDGGEACTVEAVGKETGADGLDTTLHIPVSFMTGAEISNGGISVLHGDCDFPLNAFFSDETSNYIIENAPRATLSDNDRFFRLVDASLSIWKFSDGSGETRFFVTAVHEMHPITRARTQHEAKHYVAPSDVR